MSNLEEAKKRFDKNTFPSNLRGMRLEILFRLRTQCKVSQGDMVTLKQDLECNSLFGDKMGVDNHYTIPKGEVALFLDVGYDPHIQRSVLVLMPSTDHLVYFVFDNIPAGSHLTDYFEQSYAGTKVGF